MGVRNITQRASVVAAATTLLAGVALGGSPASAMSVGGGAVLTLALAGTRGISATLSYDATPYPGGAFVVFNCKALSWTDPASTGLTTCTVNGTPAIASPNNIPGPASAAAGAVFVPDGAGAEACVGARATFIVASTPPSDLSTPEQCSTLIMVELPGSIG